MNGDFTFISETSIPLPPRFSFFYPLHKEMSDLYLLPCNTSKIYIDNQLGLFASGGTRTPINHLNFLLMLI